MNNNQNLKLFSELKASDLSPLFNTPECKSTADFSPRCFASLQLRAVSAMRSLLASNAVSALLLTVPESIDGTQFASEMAMHLDCEPLILHKLSKSYVKKDGTAAFELKCADVWVVSAQSLLEHPKRTSLLLANASLGKLPRLVITGSAGDCQDLMLLWPGLKNALHADVITTFAVSAELLGQYVASLAREGFTRHLDAKALSLLTVYCTRIYGDRRYMSLDDQSLRQLLDEASALTDKELVSSYTLLRAIGARDFRESYVAHAFIREHRDNEIILATDGQCTGQINGLSVIETAGTCYEYGEPVRISATVRAGGDGEVIDIERKAELAGQIHAKAMMIINGFIMREFGSILPIPASASLVFEQSYSEIDGDSASLTGLCAVLSAYADVPIRQDLAITGAVDQFGNVEAVGGINHKIEGFFRICALKGLTGTQGVIIPHSCVPQLVLRQSVLKAIAQGKFHIYTVAHVRGALELLTGCAWGDVDDPKSIVARVVDRLEGISNHGESTPWWHFW